MCKEIRQGDIGYYLDTYSNEILVGVVQYVENDFFVLFKPFKYKYTVVRIYKKVFVVLVKSKGNE